MDRIDIRDSKNEKMSVLKMKLTSKAYMRAIVGFSKIARKLRNKEIVNDDIVKMNVDVTVGDELKDSKGSFNFTYSNEPSLAKTKR